MTKKLVLITCLTAFVSVLFAQKYNFEYQEKEQKEIESPFVKKHYLGEDIAQKMQLLEENYTYRTMDEITRVESTNVEKPSIYYSVNKVNKYLKKSFKKGQITKQDAIEKLDTILVVAINIRYQDTQELEKELWRLKDPVALAALFSEEITLN